MDSRADLADSQVGRELLANRDFVHALALRLVRDANSADDVAQDAITRLLENERPRSIRSWLRVVVRNVTRKLGRAERRRSEVERDHAAAARRTAPATHEIAERLELQRRLTAKVLELEPRSRDVVLLHFFEGKSVAETAEQLAIPLETARTRLRRALVELRATWNQELGGEREGLAGLSVLLHAAPVEPIAAAATDATTAASIASAASTSFLWLGVATMTTKTKIAIAATIAMTMAGTYLLWPGSGLPRPRDPAVADSRFALPAPAETGPPAEAMRVDVSKTDSPREDAATPSAAAAATGELRLLVRYARDRSPAVGITMLVRERGADRRFGHRRAPTNVEGIVHFEGLRPGWVYVTSDRADNSKSTVIRAGETTEQTLEIPVGMTVFGKVVDEDGLPVPDALVEIAPFGRADRDADVLATTDEGGEFDLRDVPLSLFVGARAPGYVASQLTFISGTEGGEAEVTLVLSADGGVVEGTVVDPTGIGVDGAVIVVGEGQTTGILARVSGNPRLPALVRTDGHGRFVAVGIEVGDQPVSVRASGFAPYSGRCNVHSGITTPIELRLEPGATVEGVVRDAEGKPAESVEITVGNWPALDFMQASTTTEGRYALMGLPSGDVEIHAKHDESGRQRRTVLAIAGATVTCDMELSRGLELKGRVVDQKRVPVAEAMIQFTALPNAEKWFSVQISDQDGRFVVANFPESGDLMVRVQGDGIEEYRRIGVDPKQGELELVVRRGERASARLAGLVLAPDGKPVPNAIVSAIAVIRANNNPFWSTANDGRFVTAPLFPGAWRVEVRTDGFPTFTTSFFEVAANALVDVGTIQLVEGGRAIFAIDGERSEVEFRILDAAGVERSYVDLASNPRRPRSEPLAPGHYRLMVCGEGTAAQSIVFEIHGSRETEVAVRLERGVRQPVAVALPTGIAAPQGVMLRLERDGELVLKYSVGAKGDGRASTDLCLAPGNYTLTVSADGREESVDFTTGAGSNSTVEVDLR